jgi:hypothetical protein
VELVDGEWIEFKDRLNYGETQRLASSGITGLKSDADDVEIKELGIDFEKFQIDKLFMWITDWSIKGPNNKTARLSKDTFRRLDPEIAQEINDLLDAHIQSIENLKEKISSTNETKES